MKPQPLQLGVTLEQAKTIAEAAIAKRGEAGFEPLSIVVVNAAGQVKACLIEDGSALLRFEIAHAKAWGVLAMGFPGQAQAGFAEKMPALYNSFVALAQGKLVPAAGGVPIMQEGRIIGAVGVSGDLPHNDEACARAGIAAAGLTAPAAPQ